MKTLLTIVVGIGLGVFYVVASDQPPKQCERVGAVTMHYHENMADCLGVVEIPETPDRIAGPAPDGGALCGKLIINTENTCIIDGDKKYVLEIKPIEENTLLALSPIPQRANLTLREVEDCPCK
jgi:hypothetical protein